MFSPKPAKMFSPGRSPLRQFALFAPPDEQDEPTAEASSAPARRTKSALRKQSPATAEAELPTRAPARAGLQPEKFLPEEPLASSPASMDAPRVWTVGSLLRDVRAGVEGRYARLTVEGEISNWRRAASGHCYFTLKDADGQVAVVLFRREAAMLRFAPKDGDQIRLRGSLTVYEARGQMQIVGEFLQLAGLGAMLAAVQELKERLRREGLFDRKRTLPAFPRCIGVVTSLQGAALRDIVKVCRRRHATVNLLVYSAAVQGPRCAEEIAAGVAWFSQHPDHADVVLVARGGGSWEDLHGFNDERVVRAIAACSVPVIAGIGHATDSVLADSAADVCAPTPSAAAELVTAAQHRVEERVAELAARLRRAGGFELLHARQRYARLSADAVLRRTREGLRRREQRLDELWFAAMDAMQRRLSNRAAVAARLDARLAQQDIKVKLAVQHAQYDRLATRLQASLARGLAARASAVDQLNARANAMSPLKVLERGYALVYGPRGNLLTSSTDVRPYDTITARLADGTLKATVK
jgi:exodeoxyribonuclease VII large subunit